MKQLIGIFLAVVLMPATSSFALVGGPFGNDSYFQSSTDGIYEAVATMSNGVGIYRFAVRNQSISTIDPTTQGGILQNLSTRGNVQFGNGTPDQFTHTWFYKGVTYGGNCYGISNQSAKIVSATGNAQANSGALQNTLTVVPGGEGNDPIIFNTVTGTSFTEGPEGGNIVYANSAWMADVDEEFPVLRFSGTGDVNFTGEADIVGETRSVTNTGAQATSVNIATTTSVPTSSGSGTVVTTTTESGSNGQTSSTSDTFSGTGGDDPAFSQRGHNRKFLIFGSRVSLNVFP